MARFDIYSNAAKNRINVQFLVDVQSNVIDGLATRVVIPLRNIAQLSSMAPPGDLFPIIYVEGVPHYLDTPQLGAIPVNELRTKAGSAQFQQSEIQAALDRLFGAF